MKTKHRFKILTALVLAVAMLLPVTALAAQLPDGAQPSAARVFVDGSEVATSHGGNDPFILRGTTYLPIRALSTALGVDLNWRPAAARVYIGQAPAIDSFRFVAGTEQVIVNPATLLDFDFETEFVTVPGDEFSGWPVVAVFEELGADLRVLEQAVYMRVTAGNGTVAHIPVADALNPENAHLIYEEDRGTVRLIMAQASARGTWIRDIVEIGFVPSLGDESRPEIRIFANDGERTPQDVLGNVVRPIMLDGVIFLPLRAVANALDLEVGWDGAQNIITVGAEPEDTDPDLNSFTVTLGETVYTVEMGELEYLGFEEFTAVDRGNERVFTGVKIADVLDSLGINPEAVESITLTAANGNTSTFPDEDPLNLDSDILAVAEGGVELTPWADGGSGPFRLVRTHHTIPQQWLSNIVDITVVLGDAPDVQAAPIVVTGVDRARRTVSAEDIMDIENVAITATIRGTERNFTGVPLVDVLRLSGANYRGAESLNLRAPDGFNVFLTIEETLDETNAFIAWLEDGEPVTSYAQTPFMLVVAQDTVPMRFIRNIAEITIAAPLETGETPELGMYEFAIEAGGQTYVASMELLEELGLVDFDSGGGRYFTGVAILDILAYFEIDHSDANGLRFVTMDGLTHEWTAEEAFTEGNGFVAVLENGEPLRERDYPFRSVLVGFASNRWMGQLHVITLL